LEYLAQTKKWDSLHGELKSWFSVKRNSLDEYDCDAIWATLSNYSVPTCAFVYENIAQKASKLKDIVYFQQATGQFLKILFIPGNHDVEVNRIAKLVGSVLVKHSPHSVDLWKQLIIGLLGLYGRDEGNGRMLLTGKTALELIKLFTKNSPKAKLDVATEIELDLLRIRAYGYCQDAQSVKSIVNSLNKRKISEFYPEYLVPYYTETISAFARANDFESSVKLFTESLTQTILPKVEAAYTMLMYGAYKGLLSHCLELQSALLDAYGPVKHDSGFDLYTPIMFCCARLMLENRFARGSSENEYLLRLSAMKAFSAAYDSLKKQSIPMTEEAHETTILGLVLGNYDDHVRFPLKLASQALENMIADGFEPTRFAFHTVMRGYANSLEHIPTFERVTFITRFIEIMESCGISASAETFSILFLSFIPKGPIKPKSAQIMEKLMESENHMESSGVRHTYQSIHALLRAYGANEAFNIVYQLLDRMSSVHGLPRTHETYECVLRASKKLPSTSRYALAVLYPRMTQEGIVPSIDMIHTLLICCSKSENEDVAWDLYEELGTRQCELSHTTLNTLLRLCLLNRNIAKANFVLEEFSRRKMFLDATSFYHLLTYFSRVAPDKNKTLDTLDLLRRQADLAKEYEAIVRSNPSTVTGADNLEQAFDEGTPIPHRPSVASTTYSSQLHSELTIPDLLPMPSLRAPQSKRPSYVQCDSRLQLKLLQGCLQHGDLENAFKTYSNLLIGFHVSILHRYAAARHYIDESKSMITKESTGFGHVPNLNCPILSYPPKVLQYNPYNSAAGGLYLAKDIATATWLMATMLAETAPEILPHTFPPLRYVYLDDTTHKGEDSRKEFADEKTSRSFLDSVRTKSLPVSGRHRVAVARLVFRNCIRLLNSYLPFSTILLFEWVVDLMARLQFDNFQSKLRGTLVRQSSEIQVLEEIALHPHKSLRIVRSQVDSDLELPNFPSFMTVEDGKRSSMKTPSAVLNSLASDTQSSSLRDTEWDRVKASEVQQIQKISVNKLHNLIKSFRSTIPEASFSKEQAGSNIPDELSCISGRPVSFNWLLQTVNQGTDTTSQAPQHDQTRQPGKLEFDDETLESTLLKEDAGIVDLDSFLKTRREKGTPVDEDPLLLSLDVDGSSSFLSRSLRR
jgi:hypothetical protein